MADQASSDSLSSLKDNQLQTFPAIVSSPKQHEDEEDATKKSDICSELGRPKSLAGVSISDFGSAIGQKERSFCTTQEREEFSARVSRDVDVRANQEPSTSLLGLGDKDLLGSSVQLGVSSRRSLEILVVDETALIGGSVSVRAQIANDKAVNRAKRKAAMEERMVFSDKPGFSRQTIEAKNQAKPGYLREAIEAKNKAKPGYSGQAIEAKNKAKPGYSRQAIQAKCEAKPGYSGQAIAAKAEAKPDYSRQAIETKCEAKPGYFMEVKCEAKPGYSRQAFEAKCEAKLGYSIEAKCEAKPVYSRQAIGAKCEARPGYSFEAKCEAKPGYSRQAIEAKCEAKPGYSRQAIEAKCEAKQGYSREEMEALRFMNVGEQKRMWKDIHLGLGPAVRKEYEDLVAPNNLHCHLDRGVFNQNKDQPGSVFGVFAAKGRMKAVNVSAN